MNNIKTLTTSRLARFLIVGAGNTAVNFAILNFVFYALHVNKLTASFMATSCAILFSFILNHSFVFKNKTPSANKLLRFIIISVGGVLLIQNSIYALSTILLLHHEADIINVVRAVTGFRLNPTFVDMNLSSTIASLCGTVWNYNGYRMFVFDDTSKLSKVTSLKYNHVPEVGIDEIA